MGMPERVVVHFDRSCPFGDRRDCLHEGCTLYSVGLQQCSLAVSNMILTLISSALRELHVSLDRMLQEFQNGSRRSPRGR